MSDQTGGLTDLELWGLTDGFMSLDDIVKARIEQRRTDARVQAARSGKPVPVNPAIEQWHNENMAAYAGVSEHKPQTRPHSARTSVVRPVPVQSTPVTDETSKLTPELIKLAEHYARTYSGDNQFMVSLNHGVIQYGHLTPRQCVAALKFIKAELLAARQPQQQQRTVPAEITDALDRSAKGILSCAIPNREGTLTFYRINRPTDGKWAGRVFLSVLAGPEQHPIKDAKARATIYQAIVSAGVQNAINRYGQEIGTCGNCGLRLTDETSRAVGMGPICRGKW